MVVLAIVASVATASVWTNQSDYSPGSTVTISGDNSNGAGYVPDNTVNVAATNTDTGWSDSCSATVADDGTWSCDLTLSSDPSEAVGSYTYTATSADADGNPISEGGTFTDSFSISDATVTTFQSGCSTPSSSFTSGDTVCAHSAYTVVGANTGATFYVVWFKPDATIAFTDTHSNITANGSVNDSHVVSDVGAWTVKDCSTSNCLNAGGEGSTELTHGAPPQPAEATFTVNAGSGGGPTYEVSTDIYNETGTETAITGGNVTMGAVVEDKATVTSSDSSAIDGTVTFERFTGTGCSGTAASTQSGVTASGASPLTVSSNTYQTSGTDAANGGLSYQAEFFASGNTTTTPDATGDCENLTVASSIVDFYYTVDGGSTHYTAASPATVSSSSPHDYYVTVVIADNTGGAIYEKVQGGLNGNKTSVFTPIAGARNQTLNATCGEYAINVSKNQIVVVWDDKGDGKTNNTGFAMTDGQTCTLTVQINEKLGRGNGQSITGAWSEVQTGPGSFSGKSPYTIPLTVNVS
jgi:hypothetical protein